MYNNKEYDVTLTISRISSCLGSSKVTNSFQVGLRVFFLTFVVNFRSPPTFTSQYGSLKPAHKRTQLTLRHASMTSQRFLEQALAIAVSSNEVFGLRYFQFENSTTDRQCALYSRTSFGTHLRFLTNHNATRYKNASLQETQN